MEASLGTHWLQVLFLSSDDVPGPKPPAVLSVASGKGGVGKTAIAANLGVTLARSGKRVLLMDADLGLGNLDVIFGLFPRYTLNHFFAGEKGLDELVIEGPHGLDILPCGSGVQSVTHLTSAQRRCLMEGMEIFQDKYDLMIIDNRTGISQNATFFNMAAKEVLIVTTPELPALTSSYSLMKFLSEQHHQKRFLLVVNQSSDEKESLAAFRKLSLMATRYVDFSMEYLGYIPFDRRMQEAVSRQNSVVDLFPGCRISSNIAHLAGSLLGALKTSAVKGTPQFFWRYQLSVD